MPHALTPEEQTERQNDPTPLTRFFFRHAWLAGAASGGLIAAWVWVIGGAWPVAVGLGIGMFLWTGLVWRPGGVGQRWRRYMLRRFPKKHDRSTP